MKIDREQSEFNQAFAWLNRINYAFWNINLNASQYDASAWFSWIEVLCNELSTEFKNEEWQAFRTNQEKLHQLLTMHNKKNKHHFAGAGNIPPDIYNLLFTQTCILRKITKKSGLLTKIADDPRKAAMSGLE